MFAEGPVHIPFSLSLSVVGQHAHDEHWYRCSSNSYIPPFKLRINRTSILLRNHVLQPSEPTPDTPADVLPENGCIPMV